MKLDEVARRLEAVESLLKTFMAEQEPAPLTVEGAAELLHLSKSHIYKLCSEGSLPFYKSPGGKVSYFKRAELIAWAMSRRCRTSEEIRREV